MDLSKEQILQIIEFIVNEDDCDTGVFAKYINESNYWGIYEFSNLIKTTKRIFTSKYPQNRSKIKHKSKISSFSPIKNFPLKIYTLRSHVLKV